MKHPLLLRTLLGVGLLGCASAPDRGGAPAVALASASASVAASDPEVDDPARSYSRGSRVYAVVDEAGPFDDEASISPDGLLVALHPKRSPSIVFYDVDRRRIVGRAASAPAMLRSEAMTWLDDDHLLATGYGTEALYDARTGRLVGQVAHGVHVAIATKSGLATLVKNDNDESADLVSFADPTRSLVHIKVDGYVKAAYDIGEGAFAYLGPRGFYVFEADGGARWQRLAVLEGATVRVQPAATARLLMKHSVVTLSLRDGTERSSEEPLPSEPGAAAHERVTIGKDGVFELGRAPAASVPLVRFNPGEAERLIEPAGGASFAARCENGASATLGAVASLPPAFTPQNPRAGEGAQSRLSDSGAYRVAWTPDKVTLTELATGRARELDAGVSCVDAAFHPDGKSLITAAHVMYVGMGFHTDPDASVRVFDLATGALRKKLVGDDFRFSDDQSKLIALGREQASVYDAATYQRLSLWRGLDPAVLLDPKNRFAFVKVHDTTPSGMGPLVTKEMFVEQLATKRRVISLSGAGGYFAFDAEGSRFAFAALTSDFDENARAITIYDLPSGRASSTIRVDEPITRLAFLGGGNVLAIWTNTALVLQRLADARHVTLFAVPEATTCRLFAVDDDGHVQGEPGAKLAFRYGDDLRTSETVAATAEPGRIDDRLLEKLFAGQ